MPDKPILFSGPMVTAIREGRKTMTRRVIKTQPDHGVVGDCHFTLTGWSVTDAQGRCLCREIKPAYQPGDRLWVRETWAYATGPSRDEPDTPEHYGFIYREEWDRLQPDYPLTGAWKPSIFMPKKAARIWLEITDVRAQRLQDISEEDAFREGIERKRRKVDWHDPVMGTRMRFRSLWNTLNAKRGYPWDSNPWVWVYTFERIKP